MAMITSSGKIACRAWGSGIANEIERAIASYVKALKISPQSFAAPGWQATDTSLTVQDRQRFLYCSDTRGVFPFLPMMQGQIYQTLQIPTTLPTLDEVLGLDGMQGERVNDFFLSQLRRSAQRPYHPRRSSKAELNWTSLPPCSAPCGPGRRVCQAV